MCQSSNASGTEKGGIHLQVFFLYPYMLKKKRKDVKESNNMKDGCSFHVAKIKPIWEVLIMHSFWGGGCLFATKVAMAETLILNR